MTFLLLLMVLSLPSTLCAEDWPLFNYDENNSCFTPQRGGMDLDNPELKWQRDYPGIWTGFTYSAAGNLLTFLPMRWDQVLALNTDTGGVSFSLRGSVVGGRDQIGSYGTGEGIPLHYDITGDGIAEIFTPLDSYGIIVWDGSKRKPVWSVHLPNDHGTGYGSLNAVLGDINNDGEKELVVMDSRTTLRSIRCYDAVTGTELWVFNNGGFPGGKWLEGEVTQNFPVWLDVDDDNKPELLFQQQVNIGPDRAVEIFCIKTEPAMKTFTYLNNPPAPYSQRPIRPWSNVTKGGDPATGKYELLCVSPYKVSVNGGKPEPIIAHDRTPNRNVIPGLDLYFDPDISAGDRATVYVHNSPAVVWKKTFVSGYCFAHFLLSDFNNDGEQEIAFGTTGKYYLIDRHGDVLWEYDTGIKHINEFEDVVYGGAFADIDEDGIKEIVFIAFDRLICLKGDTGEARWTFQAPWGDINLFLKTPVFVNALRAYPLIADIGGSPGGLEIITADAEHVYALDRDGGVVMKYRYARYAPLKNRSLTPDGSVVMFPYTSKRFIFADIDGDGKGELVGSYVIDAGRVMHRVFCLE